MFKNCFVAALRSMAKQRLFSAINILGLGIGIACLLILSLQIMNELSFDKWIPDHEQVFRLESTYHIPGRDEFTRATSMLPAKSFLDKDFPQIELSARAQPFWVSLTRDNTLFNERIFFADPEILEILGLAVIEGDLKGALESPTSIVLTRSTKEKYFADSPAVGESLLIDGDVPYLVTAVIEDLPAETHLVFSAILPLAAPNYYFRQYVDQDWDVATVHTYLKLRSPPDAANIEQGLADFVSRNVPTFNIAGTLLTGAEALELSLRPVTDIHLYSSDSRNLKPGGSINEIYALIVISFLIFGISCVNFVNLTSAQFTERWHEVAIRKICGARRQQLIFQFLSESYLLVLLALGAGFVLTEVLLPNVNEYLGKTLTFNLFADPELLFLVAGTLVFIGLVGGLFPAWLVSGSKPAAVLAEGNVFKVSRSGLRGALVVLQFAISVGLIIMTFVVHSQTQFARSLDTGFETADRIVLFGTQRGAEETRRIVEALRNGLLANPDVISVAGSSNVPGLEQISLMRASLVGLDSLDEMTVSIMSVGDDFFETYGIRALAGRDFDLAFPADELTGQRRGSEVRLGSAVINETAANRFGLSVDAALGQTIRLNFGAEDAAPYEVRVIGVVPDLHLRSARDSIEPQVFVNNPHNFNFVTVQVDPGKIDAILPPIEQTWDRVLPDQPISWSFVDDILVAQYDAEDRQGLTLTVASILATLIASMGLYGMAAFAVAKKTKEIGVRKVFGASIRDILRLIVFQFSKPVLIANLIAWPVTWYFMRDWLADFVYRIDLSPLFFFGPGLGVLVIAWITVGGHALRVARANPINALRYE